MRQLTAGFAQKLQGSATTLCLAWHFIRNDAVNLRFSNHDRDLNIDGELYIPAKGYNIGHIEANANLAPDSFNLNGAYEVDGINEIDIRLGRWDRAKIRVLVVDWMQSEYFAQIWCGFINGFKQSEFGFEIELIGPEHDLANTIGRKYSKQCSAKLGDIHCKYDLANSEFNKIGIITKIVSDRKLEISGTNIDASLYSGGQIEFRNGTLIGTNFDVIEINQQGNYYQLIVSTPLPISPQIGDEIILISGCNKSFEMCKNRYSNQVNFRGFPNMPGEDFAFAVAK